MHKPIYLVSIIIYSTLAFLVQALSEVSFIDAFTVFLLMGILDQILDWKYGEEENDNG